MISKHLKFLQTVQNCQWLTDTQPASQSPKAVFALKLVLFLARVPPPVFYSPPPHIRSNLPSVSLSLPLLVLPLSLLCWQSSKMLPLSFLLLFFLSTQYTDPCHTLIPTSSHTHTYRTRSHIHISRWSVPHSAPFPLFFLSPPRWRKASLWNTRLGIPWQASG